MRGLTTAEHELLAVMAAPGPDHEFETGDICEVRLLSLHGAGRAALSFEVEDGQQVRHYSITELGRLALRLWPLNRSES